MSSRYSLVRICLLLNINKLLADNDKQPNLESDEYPSIDWRLDEKKVVDYEPSSSP
jgi:hypothetical protein